MIETLTVNSSSFRMNEAGELGSIGTLQSPRVLSAYCTGADNRYSNRVTLIHDVRWNAELLPRVLSLPWRENK
jgi:hypothetical protein